MRNPVLKIMMSGNRKFRVVALGDNDAWGKGRAMLSLPGQPHFGSSYASAVDFAKTWGEKQLVEYCNQYQGSYASENKRKTLADIEAPHASPPNPPAVTPETSIVLAPALESILPNALDTQIRQLDKVANLIVSRRQCLKTLHLIDQELLRQLGPEVALVIKEGMARPINGPGIVSAGTTDKPGAH